MLTRVFPSPLQRPWVWMSVYRYISHHNRKQLVVPEKEKRKVFAARVSGSVWCRPCLLLGCVRLGWSGKGVSRNARKNSNESLAWQKARRREKVGANLSWLLLHFCCNLCYHGNRKKKFQPRCLSSKYFFYIEELKCLLSSSYSVSISLLLISSPLTSWPHDVKYWVAGRNSQVCLSMYYLTWYWQNNAVAIWSNSPSKAHDVLSIWPGAGKINSIPL